LICAFAFSDIGDNAHVLEIARVISAGVRNHVEVLDDTIGQEHSMLNIQIHAVLRRTIPELSHIVQVIGMNPIEYQIERRIRFS
jgi:hypothetical protein